MTQNSRFTPPSMLKNPHIQSILNSLGPRKIRAKRLTKKLDSEMLTLTAKDGTRLLAEYDRSQTPNHSLIVLIHGWEGSSQSAYQVTTANYLLKQGFDVLRLNLRDHGDSHHLNFELFNSTMTNEVAEAIACFFETHTYEKRFLAGFSLGGNFTLRIAADHGSSLGLTAAAAICPPVDPTNAMTALENTLFIYERYFFYRWSKSLRKKITHFPEHGFEHILNSARTIEDMNSFFIDRHTPFKDAKSYFEAYSLIGDRLQALAIPAYLIASEDDPIIPVEDLQQINCPEKLTIELQEYGGHCGFIKNLSAHSWVENRLVDLFRGYL